MRAPEPSRVRALGGEFLGTFMLLAVVVGSGIMGERLAAGNAAVALLANALATAAGLYVLIHVFGPISGAHFNPVVSAWFRLRGELSTPRMLAYWLVQTAGAVLGVWFAHAMFGLDVLQTSAHARDGLGIFASEVFATFGLLLTIASFLENQRTLVPAGVAAYIGGAYWFTSSTSFANPAVTVARALTNTFAGIAPHSVPLFIIAQATGFLVFVLAWKILRSPDASSASR
jgi:glycerol uptake facilitator-like aquaporin